MNNMKELNEEKKPMTDEGEIEDDAAEEASGGLTLEAQMIGQGGGSGRRFMVSK